MESDSMSVINSTASTLFDIGIKISAKSKFFELQQLVAKQLSYAIIIQRIQLHKNPSMEETDLCKFLLQICRFQTGEHYHWKYTGSLPKFSNAFRELHPFLPHHR
jgi:hypothetical protein